MGVTKVGVFVCYPGIDQGGSDYNGSDHDRSDHNRIAHKESDHNESDHDRRQSPYSDLNGAREKEEWSQNSLETPGERSHHLVRN